MEKDNTMLKLFTQRMRQLRLEKGEREGKELTQVDISNELGIHVSTIRSYESPSLGMIPKVERLRKIKNYYNVSYEYLLGETSVKDFNLNTISIQNETKLSEKSINFLKSLDKNDEFINILNTLIESTSKARNKKEDNQQ